MAALRWIAITAVTAALLVLGLWQAGLMGGGGGNGSASETVEIKGERFYLEVAADQDAIAQGLMHRESIDPDGGMIFIFPRPSYRSFWMGNCLVDIDLIFLDEIGRVVSLHEMKAEAPKRPDETEEEYAERLADYPSGKPVQFAIELKAGTIDRLGIEPGDSIDLDLRRLKRMAR